MLCHSKLVKMTGAITVDTQPHRSKQERRQPPNALAKVQRRHVPRGAKVVCGAAVERGGCGNGTLTTPLHAARHLRRPLDALLT